MCDAEAGPDTQKQRPEAELEATGKREAEACGRGRPGRALDRSSELRFGNRPSSLGSTASGENHRSHMWP